MSKKIKFFGLIIIIIIGLVVGVCGLILSESSEASVISQSELKEIINVSELSTYQAIFNSYCTVYNEKNTEDVDYRVAYNAKVDIGIDFGAVHFNIDEKENVVTMILPEPQILDVEVDVSTLEFLFENERADKSTVSGEAYSACIDDVNDKVKDNGEIHKIAQQNAENACRALVNPFLEQLTTPYELVVKKGEYYEKN